MNNALYAIVPASGIGSRMQADRPKQYLPLNGKLVIEHTLERLLSFKKIEKIVVIISADDCFWSTLSIAKHPKIATCLGGAQRADSVFNGLQYLRTQDINENAWVMVHDAARPCVRHEDLSQLFQLANAQGVILGVPVRDTMKRTDDHAQIIQTVDRENLWHALTPQLSTLGNLYQSINSAQLAGVDITDEASALEFAGYHPSMVLGHVTNIKITHPDDLELAEMFLKVTD